MSRRVPSVTHWGRREGAEEASKVRGVQEEHKLTQKSSPESFLSHEK